MKKYLFTVVMILIAAVLFAADFGAPVGKNVTVVFQPEVLKTILSAQTATGDGSVHDVGFTPGRTSCVVSYGGTAPTSMDFTLKGGVASTDLASLFTHTYTIATATTKAFTSYYPYRYIKISYDAKAGGGADTAATVICVFGGGN